MSGFNSVLLSLSLSAFVASRERGRDCARGKLIRRRRYAVLASCDPFTAVARAGATVPARDSVRNRQATVKRGTNRVRIESPALAFNALRAAGDYTALLLLERPTPFGALAKSSPHFELISERCVREREREGGGGR